MKFLHTADIHLDSPLLGLAEYDGAPVDEIRNATRRALEAIVDLAVAEQVDFVLIAGDVYDGSWRDYNTGLFLIQQLSRLSNAQIQAFLIAGNHDAASVITKELPLPSGCFKFGSKKPETVQLDKIEVAIHGQSFPSNEPLRV